uniref:Small ribosomal subunit protein uS15 N-terminal domain-containing protein n=1 Tax=Microcebus murinus TaxID=30608 RepID=A0A8C5XYF9_MICMU
MGRTHAPGEGLSQSALPHRRSVPTWLQLTSEDMKEQIYKLAKKGLAPSQMQGECTPKCKAIALTHLSYGLSPFSPFFLSPLNRPL